jgi:hypothetical protein
VPDFFSGCHAVNKEDQLPAAAVARMLRTLLFGVSPLDPLSFAAVPFLLAAAAALASLLRLHVLPGSILWMRLKDE